MNNTIFISVHESPWIEPRLSIRTKIFEGCFQPNFVDSKQLPIYFPYFTFIFTCIKGVASTEFCITSSMIKKRRKLPWYMAEVTAWRSKNNSWNSKTKMWRKIKSTPHIKQCFWIFFCTHIFGIWTYRPLLWNEPIDHIIPIFNFPDPYRH